MNIQIIPTVLATIAWGCSLNMLVFGAHAIKEGWNVPSVAFMSAPRILGRVGCFVPCVLQLGLLGGGLSLLL